MHSEHDQKVFDCVVVITDRQVLDRQLQDAIYQIEHAQGVVKAIDENSKQLAQALAATVVVEGAIDDDCVVAKLVQALSAPCTRSWLTYESAGPEMTPKTS